VAVVVHRQARPVALAEDERGVDGGVRRLVADGDGDVAEDGGGVGVPVLDAVEDDVAVGRAVGHRQRTGRGHREQCRCECNEHDGVASREIPAVAGHRR
jgi:hypothetical protein